MDEDVLTRRIRSARVLRAMSQRDVGRAMKAAGYGSEDIARLERQDPEAPQFHDGRRKELAKILQVPEWWFTVADDDLFASPGTLEERLAAVEEFIRQDVQPRLEQMDEPRKDEPGAQAG